MTLQSKRNKQFENDLMFNEALSLIINEISNEDFKELLKSGVYITD